MLAVALIATVTVTVFVLTRLVPGDPIDAMVGQFPVPDAYEEQIRQDFGLDEPLPTQLWLYVKNLAGGNFGFSFANRSEVLPLLVLHGGRTLMLMLPALTIAAIGGVLLGGAAARNEGRLLDTVLSSTSLIGLSVPVFWLGQMLILVFAVNLGLLPAQGMRTIGASLTGSAALADYLRHLILPATTIAVTYMAIIARVARASLIQAMDREYATLALSKGVSERRVYWRHVFPNGSLPIITVIGYTFGYALTGAILTETVFGWPGLGYLFINSITGRDYPVLVGIFFFAAFAVVAANLLVDMCYAAIDPRIRRKYVAGI